MNNPKHNPNTKSGRVGDIPEEFLINYKGNPKKAANTDTAFLMLVLMLFYSN